MNINWFVVLITGIWFSASIGEVSTKNGNCVLCALLATIFIGIGYFILNL